MSLKYEPASEPLHMSVKWFQTLQAWFVRKLTRLAGVGVRQAEALHVYKVTLVVRVSSRQDLDANAVVAPAGP